MILRLLLLLSVSMIAQSASVTGVMTILPTSQVQLRDPRSISVAADGMLFVADTGHHRVIAVDSTGQLVVETGGFGSEHGQFEWPRTVIADYGAAVWVLDYGNRRIEKFSRRLEYQGTLQIPSEDDSPPAQIEACALSPQSDLYVYDRDGGRILRYDPLFRVQGELGRDRGGEFVSALSRMTFVSGLGLIWWERGGDRLQTADPLLTQIQPLNFKGGATSSIILTPSDSCLIFGTMNTLSAWCDPVVPPDTLVSLSGHPDLPLKRLDDITFVNGSTLYVLDGAAGAVYRVSLSER